MNGQYRIRFHFVGGGKTDQHFATAEERDVCFEGLLDQLVKGEDKWIILGAKTVNRLKLTHVEKFEKTAKGERT